MRIVRSFAPSLALVAFAIVASSPIHANAQAPQAYPQGPAPYDQQPGPQGGATGGPPLSAPDAAPGATGGGHMSAAQKFDAANVSHDGKLTRDQAQSGGFKAVAKNFDAIDRDHKGYVTKQDVREWHRARHAAKLAARQQQQAPQAPPQ